MTPSQSASTNANHLLFLHNLSRLLDSASDISDILNNALDLMGRHLGLLHGSITLIESRTDIIRIEAAYGLNAAQRRRGSYLKGEGITGRVITSGKPMCINDVAREPLFLNRTRCRNLAKERITFICVPIKLDGHVVGAISTDAWRNDNADLEAQLRLLEIISTMLAYTAAKNRKHGETVSEHSARPPDFVGNSENMRQVYAQIAMVAPASVTVLLQGESGTGKELAAKAIHNAGSHASGPFVPLNCAALPESLIESELFGHQRGAFTGAIHTRKGRFELAQGGTLFLDEIAELSPLIQAKLLRVLQDHTFERLGGMESISTDARVIAATNRDLEKMVEEGQFRRDLFYRLNVFTIFLPPLRERAADIIALATHFLDRSARSNHRKCPRLSQAAIEMLQRHPWPGNIRELQNIMERAILVMGRENVLMPRHLPEALRAGGGDSNNAPASAPPVSASSPSLGSHLDEVERDSIIGAMKKCSGRINRAAAMLGITERVLGLRLKKYGIDYKSFRRAPGKATH